MWWKVILNIKKDIKLVAFLISQATLLIATVVLVIVGEVFEFSLLMPMLILVITEIVTLYLWRYSYCKK